MTTRKTETKSLPAGDPNPAWDRTQHEYLTELLAEAKAEPAPDAPYIGFLKREIGKVAQRLGLEPREEEEAA